MACSSTGALAGASASACSCGGCAGASSPRSPQVLDLPGSSTSDDDIQCGVGLPSGSLRANGDLRPKIADSGPMELTAFGAFVTDPSGNAFHGMTEAIRRGLREGRWESLLLPGDGALRARTSTNAGMSKNTCGCSQAETAPLVSLLRVRNPP